MTKVSVRKSALVEYLMAYHMACELAEVQELVERGAVVNSKGNGGYWRTPLGLAAFYGKHGIVRYLLKKKAVVNMADSSGMLPLHYAVLAGNEAMVKLLLNHKADVNACDEQGDTPLHKAAYFGSVAMVKLLLKHRTDRLVVNGTGKTPRDEARDQKHSEIAEILLN